MYHGSDYAKEVTKMNLENARAVEKMNESKRRGDELNTSIARLDMIVCAMWELMQENGISSEALYGKIDDIIMRRKANVYSRSIIECPKCGKPIQESNKTPMLGRCVYCGETVTFYPYMDYSGSADDTDGTGETGDSGESGENGQAEEKPVEENKPFDPIGNLEDLGF